MTTSVSWHLYLLDCDGRVYTGISTDPARRLKEHRAAGTRSARFTRGAERLELIWQVEVGSRSLAQKAEYRLRRLPRREKLAIARTEASWARLRQRLFEAASLDANPARKVCAE
ncbi:MAG: GIY-YIG nuclease family protein [Gammaproteobacteria bacterium]|nr:MAG: GIY-YIG nuclease family protein [Gammaproteobacteria bacterium]